VVAPAHRPGTGQVPGRRPHRHRNPWRTAVTAADRPSVTDDARAEAVEAIKAHLTDRYVDHDAEEIAWNVLNIAADMWGEQEAAGRAETTAATTEDAQTGTFEAILAAHRDEY